MEEFLARPMTVKQLMGLGAWGFNKKKQKDPATGKMVDVIDPVTGQPMLDKEDPKKPSTMSIEDGEGPDGQPDGTIFGSAIWGAKIGNGFYSNLRGEYSPVTQDLWFTRTFGRMTGTLADVSKSADATRKTYQTFADAMVSDGLWTQDQADEAMADPNLVDPQSAISQEAMRQYGIGQKFYAENNKAIQAGTVKQSLVGMKSKRVENLLTGVNDQPGSASDRAWRAGIMNRTREMLQADGVDLSNADLQALIWFPEKDLWKKLGSKGGRGGNRDYSSAQQTLARKNGKDAGVSTEQIDARIAQLIGAENVVADPTREELERAKRELLEEEGGGEEESGDDAEFDLGHAPRGRGRPDGDDPGGERGIRQEAGGERLEADTEEDLTPAEAKEVYAALERLEARLNRLGGV
jgi:hypothetical protein